MRAIVEETRADGHRVVRAKGYTDAPCPLLHYCHLRTVNAYPSRPARTVLELNIQSRSIAF
jgi:hypothetical protein